VTGAHAVKQHNNAQTQLTRVFRLMDTTPIALFREYHLTALRS